MPKKFDLLVLSILLIVLNSWFILIPYGFSHDTSFVFEIFYFFYNHFTLHHELPQWMPYYAFGIPSHLWQLCSLSIVQYFVMALGSLFKITNILLMFKVSLVGEQLLFLLGMFLLSKHFFKNRSTVLFVCLASMASLFSYHELFFDFRIYYLLPLTLYFLVRFFQENRPEFFWAAGITFLAWWLGNANYMIFVSIPPLLFIAIALAAINKGLRSFKCLLEPSFKNMGLGAVFLVISFCICFLFKSFTDFVDYPIRIGGIKNSLSTFLTFGTYGETLQEYFKRFVGGYYLGSYPTLLACILCLWGALKSKGNAYHRIFLLTGLGFLWFSFGGLWTSLWYFFPSMSYYRHIAYMYGFVKIFILICAGFGLDLFWQSRLKEKVLSISIILLLFIFLSDALGLSTPWLTHLLSHPQPAKALGGQMMFSSTLFRLGIYVATLAAMLVFKKDRAIKFILMTALCLDIGSYQYQMFKEVRFKFLPWPREIVNSLGVHLEQFRLEHTQLPPDDRALNVMLSLKDGNRTQALYSVAQFYPCESKLRGDVQPKGLTALLSPTNGDAPLKQPLKEILGCDAPILRIEKDLEKSATKPLVMNYPVEVLKFNSDEIIIKADAPLSGAWLVYADSYHPGWHATVNNKKQLIEKAYGTFKAINVKGASNVRLYFNDGLATICSNIILWFGIAMTLFFVALFFYA